MSISHVWDKYFLITNIAKEASDTKDSNGISFLFVDADIPMAIKTSTTEEKTWRSGLSQSTHAASRNKKELNTFCQCEKFFTLVTEPDLVTVSSRFSVSSLVFAREETSSDS